jgi:hypothetical protein
MRIKIVHEHDKLLWYVCVYVYFVILIKIYFYNKKFFAAICGAFGVVVVVVVHVVGDGDSDGDLTILP